MREEADHRLGAAHPHCPLVTADDSVFTDFPPGVDFISLSTRHSSHSFVSNHDHSLTPPNNTDCRFEFTCPSG